MSKVTQDDLKGQIKDFPVHVVQAMCDEQVRQGNKFNPSVFAWDVSSDEGFNWLLAEKGCDFWNRVISEKQFHLIKNTEIQVDVKQKKEITGHPHADLMLKYALIAKNNISPWEEFEYLDFNGGNWIDCNASISWFHDVEYRLKQKTIKIGEYDVPEPLRYELPLNEPYFTVCFLDADLYDCYKWNGLEADKYLLRNGLVHATKEGAILHAKALLSLTKLSDQV